MEGLLTTCAPVILRHPIATGCKDLNLSWDNAMRSVVKHTGGNGESRSKLGIMAGFLPTITGRSDWISDGYRVLRNRV